MLKHAKTESEIKLRGIEALNKFSWPCRCLEVSDIYAIAKPTDYVKVSHDLTRGKTSMKSSSALK